MRGRLIVFEGLDGAGKTTQIELLRKHLTQLGYPVVMTGWNSSRLISKAIKRAKKARLLTPHLYSALHAADFMYRLEHVILPALHEGYVVLADRYSYTGLARDLARGIDRSWVEEIYALSLAPDLAFYCKTPIEEALGRIIGREGGGSPAYYEAGMDVGSGSDPIAAYRAFQTRVAAEYEWICREYGLVDVDTALPIDDVHRRIAQTVDERLKTWDGAPPSPPLRPLRLPADEKGPGEFPRLASHGMPGRLIVIEGPDATVRKRQATLLYNELTARGVRAHLVLQNCSWVGIEVARKAMRKTLLTMPTRVLLAAAESALYHEQTVVPALREGEVVVADGYLGTLFIRSVAAGLSTAWWRSVFTAVAVQPDVTLYIDAALAGVTAGAPEDLLSFSPAAADLAVRQSMLEQYRALAASGGWMPIAPAPTEAELHRALLPAALAALPPGEPAGRSDDVLRAVFAALARYDDDDTHPRKVAELAVALFDQTASFHRGGERERRLLTYAAYLHDIGHALSEKRHEEFTYEAIMRESFGPMPEADREIMANVACLHRLPYTKMKFDHLARLSGAKQVIVKQLAALLRIADALDESGKLVVRDVRCYEEHGVMFIDIHAVGKALPERAAVLRKADMFERVYQKPVVVARNWIEKRGRRAARDPKEFSA